MTDRPNKIVDGAIMPYDDADMAQMAIDSAPLPLAPQVAAAIQQVLAYADVITARITNTYPQSEVDSWPTQLAEARLVVAGQTPPDPSLLAALVAAANSSDVTMASLANSIITNATAYQKVVAAVQTVRLAAQAQLAAVTDPSQIPAILTTLKATADSQAQAMGI